MIHAHGRPKRLPRLARTGWVLGLLLLCCLAAAGRAAGQEIDAAALAVPRLLAPTPEPTETPRYQQTGRGSRPSVARWAPLLEAYADWDVRTALRVIDCESAGDPAAVNPLSGAVGLWQTLGWGWLARRLFGTTDMTDPWINTAVAHVLWLDSGGSFRSHWYASISCWGGR